MSTRQTQRDEADRDAYEAVRVYVLDCVLFLARRGSSEQRRAARRVAAQVEQMRPEPAAAVSGDGRGRG